MNLVLRSVEFSGTSDNPYKINLVKPDQSQFIINDIGGLGAGKADLHTAQRASMDGDVFNGARLGSRNLTFEFGYGYKLDPEIGREISYEVFPLKENVTMKFVTDTKTVTINGYIESNETSIFTAEPAFDLSIMCTDPYFKSIPEDREVLKLYSLVSLFEFPFSNESLTEDLIIFGEHASENFAELLYQGSQSTGVLIRFVFNGEATHPSITNDRTRQTMRIDTDVLTNLTGRPLGPGDVIEINTVRGQKSVNLIRNGRYVNIINSLARASQWITLLRGINPISVNADTGIQSVQTEVIYDIYYAGL